MNLPRLSVECMPCLMTMPCQPTREPNAAPKGPAPPLQKRSESSPEHMARELEREVHALLEESAAFASGAGVSKTAGAAGGAEGGAPSIAAALR